MGATVFPWMGLRFLVDLGGKSGVDLGIARSNVLQRPTVCLEPGCEVIDGPRHVVPGPRQRRPDLVLDSYGDGGDPVVELVAVGRHAVPDAAQGRACRNEIICVHFQDHGSSLAEQASRAPRLSTGPRPTCDTRNSPLLQVPGPPPAKLSCHTGRRNKVIRHDHERSPC